MKTFEAYSPNQRQMYNPRQAMLLCLAGRNKGYVETLYTLFFPLKPGTAQAESQAGEIEGEA